MNTFRQILLLVSAVSTCMFFSGCAAKETESKQQTDSSVQLTLSASTFQPTQRLGKQTELVITVQNRGQANAKNVAITLTGLTHRVKNPESADEQHPVWIIDAGPLGGTTTSSTTWALGTLSPGRSRSFSWKLTPVIAGDWKLHYRIAPDLQTPAKLSGTLKTTISSDTNPPS